MVTLDGLGREQDSAAQNHRREADPDPRQKLSRDRRNRAASHDQAKQTEIKNRGRPEHHARAREWIDSITGNCQVDSFMPLAHGRL